MIQTQLQSDVERLLEAQAEACGISFSNYLENVLTKQAAVCFGQNRQKSVAEAVANIRAQCKENTLNGLKIGYLIHEGHKY